MRVLRTVAAIWLAALSISPAVAGDARFDALVSDAKTTMLADPPATVATARKAEQYAATEPDATARVVDLATARWLQGEAYLRLRDLGSAAPLIQKAYDAVSKRRPPTKLNGDILLSWGGLHAAKAEAAAALSDYQTAHNIFRDIGETRSQAIALISIGAIYNDANDSATALKYYGQAINLYRGDPSLSIAAYNNRGNALKDFKRYAEAEEAFGKALSLARQMKSPLLQAKVLGNIGQTWLLIGKLDKADRAIAEGLRLLTPDQTDFRPLLAMAAQSALQRGDTKRAAMLITRSLKGADVTQTTVAMHDAHQTAYEIYRRLGRPAEALEHLAAVKRLDDDSTKLATQTNIALMAARFNSTNQELRIAKLKADESQRNFQFAQARARFQQILFVGIVLAALIGVSMLAFGYVQIRRSRNRVRAANVDLAASNVALGKALAAKTEFLATTSHEIRTPLNGILGMTQVMLADRGLGEPTRDRIGIVHSAGLTMRALVDDILDVAKMETGNLTVESIPLDLRGTLRDVTRIWEEQARAKGLEFVLDLDRCPGYVLGDPARLQQIVFNLLSNAVKFTERGTVSVCATSDADPSGGDRIRIAIGDSGIGIAIDKQAEIFESFKQADGGTTRKFGGTGLGLTIVRNLATAMDGTVSVHSVPGEGATFTIDLPLRAAEQPETAAATGGTGGLLIVDRNPIARSMLRAVLEARAGSVSMAGDLDEAAAILASASIATVLIDHATATAAGEEAIEPGLTALTKLAREVGAKTALLTSEPDPAMLSRFGLDRIIGKPIAGAALAEQLFGAERLETVRSPLVSHAA